MEYSTESAPDSMRVELPHVFGFRGEHLPDGLNMAVAEAEMLSRPPDGIREIYQSSGSAWDSRGNGYGDWYRRGFAGTTSAIHATLQATGQRLPSIAPDNESLSYYLLHIDQEYTHPQHQHWLKLALLAHERPLLEMLGDASGVQEDWQLTPFYDGVVNAYMMLAEATRLRSGAEDRSGKLVLASFINFSDKTA